MFWIDRIAQEITERFKTSAPILVRDEKTPSGRVHIGSMRGVAIHASVAEALAEKGAPVSFRYEINDFDPMDDIPSYLPRETFEEHLGKPLCMVPSPDESAENYAEYFGGEFSRVIEAAGWTPEFYRSSGLYRSGAMDEAIREALLGASDIRRIYQEVSGGKRKEDWLPLSVICPQCGKMSTTTASDFDGETVSYVCRENAVDWTRGCGAHGRISPFGGNAKLPWKAEWPAKWKVLGVSVEGGGKDHSTKGGSRDVANHISRDVFHYEPPFDIPYEFFLVGGKKMSSSKGRGSSAREIAEMLPPTLLRFALLSKDINQAIDFDPEGDTIPVLYDTFDKMAEQYKAGVRDDYARLFWFAHPLGERADIQVPFLLRFSQVVFLAQMPHLSIEEEAARIKGEALTPADIADLKERTTYARRWIERYAPEKFKFAIQETLPDAAQELTPLQKDALRTLADFVQKNEAPTGEELHHRLHEMKDELSIAPAQLFSAIYIAFLGKSYGPKAGWFLSVLPRDFLLRRLVEASS